MFADYHIHTFLSGDAKGEILGCVKIAFSKKLEEIGISDHYIPERFKDKLDKPSAYEKLSDYVKKVCDLERKTKDIIKLKVGVEVDFIPGFEDEIKDALKGLPFDYIIGSVHFIEGWAFDNPKYIMEYQKWDSVKLYERYFTAVQACAESKLFDVIGHPDLIKNLGVNRKPTSQICMWLRRKFLRIMMCALRSIPAGYGILVKKYTPTSDF